MKKERYNEILTDFEWLRYKEDFLPGDKAKLSNMLKKYLDKNICPSCGNLWNSKFMLMDYFCQIISQIENGNIIVEDEEQSVVQKAIENVKNFSTATEKLKQRKQKTKK